MQTLGRVVFLLFLFSTVARGASRDGRFHLFFGADLGFSILQSNISGEENKSGLGVGGKGLVSYYWPSVVAEIGSGFFLKTISGTRPSGLEATLETRTIFAELGARIRWGNAMQVGPFLTFHFPGDLSHRPTVQPVLAGEADRDSMLLTGLQILYETESESTPLRFGLRLGMDLDVPNRSLYEIQAVFHIGFPLGSGGSSYSSSYQPPPAYQYTAPAPTPPPVAAPAPAPTTAPPSTFVIQIPSEEAAQPAPIEKPSPAVTFTLPKLEFKKGTATLLPKTKKALDNVGKAIADAGEAITSVEIVGYDSSAALGARQAGGVAGLFKKQGVPADKIKTSGQVIEKPQTNRKIDLQIRSLSDSAKILRELRKAAKPR